MLFKKVVWVSEKYQSTFLALNFQSSSVYYFFIFTIIITGLSSSSKPFTIFR